MNDTRQIFLQRTYNHGVTKKKNIIKSKRYWIAPQFT